MSDRAEVWLLELATVDRDREREWLRWLTAEEKEKYGRFVTEELRREYLATRALCRWVLSRWLSDVEPSDWRFDRTEAGKPFVAAPPAREVPYFNLANAGGLVACAVSTRPVGVDVEARSRGDDLFATSSRARLFSRRELEELRRLDEHGQRQRMVELWTLKEAYLKARGHGISVHLDRFGVVESGDEGTARGMGTFRLDDDALDGDSAAWQLEVSSYRDCRVAVAVLRGSAPNLAVTYQAME